MEGPMTASSIISFAEKLEDESSRFYEELAGRYAKNRETYLSFAKENRKNMVLVTRTYRETISDALEACFSFRSLNLNEYMVVTTLTEKTTYSNALKVAIELEEKASKFYLDVAELSESLLATIPRAFRKVAERRNNTKLKLKLLLEGLAPL